MNGLVAALLVARIADGLRLRRDQEDNTSSFFVGDLEQDETLLEAIKVESREQDNRSDSRVEHVGGDGKLPEAKDVDKHNQTLLADPPLQQAMALRTTPDSWPRIIGTRAAIIATVTTFIIVCCLWCLPSEVQSDPNAAARRSRDRRNTTSGMTIDDQRTSVYLTYWDLDGNDPERPWNPTKQGGKDGVQLAIVEDSEVRRIPTDGICTKYGSAMHRSKEWHHLNTNTIHVVNYLFDAMPSASKANQCKDKYGVKELDLRRTVWGNRTLAVGAVFEAFHRRGRDAIN